MLFLLMCVSCVFVFPLTDIAGVSPIGAPGRSSNQGTCTPSTMDTRIRGKNTVCLQVPAVVGRLWSHRTGERAEDALRRRAASVRGEVMANCPGSPERP
ncbi:hypothetical protein GGI35DRAFT_442106 [Trichoderma velutinum]